MTPDQGDGDACLLRPRQALVEEHVGQEERHHRIQRAEHRDEREEAVAAREREQRVRRHVREADGGDRPQRARR